jgi:hypothetical protein
MQPIYFTVGTDLSLMIIPDTQAHLDGHTIITQTYHLYQETEDALGRKLFRPDDYSGVNKDKNPAYMGYLTFDVPGRVYSYTGDGHSNLSPTALEKLIDYLNMLRNNPPMWPKQDF